VNSIYNKQGILSKERIVVACDLFLDLRLYHLPKEITGALTVNFPNVEIVPVNITASKLYDKDAEIYWGNRITSDIIRAMNKLRWIHFGSVGVNRARVPEVIDRNILVTSSKGCVIAPMVASALAFISGLARGLHRSEKLRQQGIMNRKNFDQYFDQIHELAGEECLIVGYGDVGKRLKKICLSLGMSVSIINRKPLVAGNGITASYHLDDLAVAVADVDYVVNLLPLNSETEKVFTLDVFKSMKPSAFFINIGRGETVDERGLIQALETGLISGAGLDVFENEPLHVESALWTLDNVMLSPHVAGLSDGYWDRQYDLFKHNLLYFLEGKQEVMKNIVDIRCE